MMKFFLPILLAALALLPLTAHAADNPPLHLSAAIRHASLSGHLALHVDTQGTLPFAAARQAEYVPLDGFRSAGYTKETHWYRFVLTKEVDAPHDWVLAMGAPYLDDIRVWMVAADDHIREYRLGDHVAFSERPMQTRMHAMRFDLEDSRPVTVYVRVQSTSAINFSAEVWQTEAFIADETRNNFYLGFYFGVLGIVIVLYLLFGAWLRDAGMLAYAGYVGCIFLMYLGINGFEAITFATGSEWVADALPGFGMHGSIIAAAAMWIWLLDIRRHFPRTYRVYQAVIILNLCLLPFVGTQYYRLTAQLAVVTILILAAGNIALPLKLWLQQRKPELLLYFFAFLTPGVATLCQISMVLGWLPHNFLTANILQISSLVHILVMNAGLAMRIRQIQRDKLLAEQSIDLSNQRAEEQRRFVAMLSHEFRNPLAAIDRSAQMLQLKLPDSAPPEKERLKNIRTRVGSLSSLVDNFLMSEALDHQALALSPAPCPIRSLLESVVQTLGETVGDRVKLEVTPPDATFPLDQSLIAMAVGNLLANALRYSPPDSQVELSASAAGSGLSIRILDHGTGLRKEELEKLGTPYYRASSSVGKKGSGLGYLFSRKIVEAHGGSLQASSPAGMGLEVVIRLPVEEKRST